ncbi:Tyrosine-protein kinase Fgr, partial [Geodia barretti]
LSPPREQCPRATALYTSPAETGEGLSISQGDTLHILSLDNQEWWYGVNDATGMTGFVPCTYVSESLRSYRWYLGNTSHSNADNLLKQESNATGEYTLDLAWAHRESNL